MKYKQLIETAINEANVITVNDLVKEFDSVISKIFPKSYLKVFFSERLLPSINITFAYGDKKTWKNGIYDNDPATHKLMIHFSDGVTLESEVPDRMTIELVVGGSISVPSTNPMYVFDRAKVGWRKKTGNYKQIVKHVENYFKKLKTVIDAHIEEVESQFQ